MPSLPQTVVNMMTRYPARLKLTRTAMMTTHPRNPARLRMTRTAMMTTHPMVMIETIMLTANTSQETAKLRMLLKPLPSPERTTAVLPKLDSPWLYSGLSPGTTSPQL